MWMGLSGKAWLYLFENMTAFTMKKDYRKEEREVKSQWALAQRTLHGWKLLAEQAERRAEIARLRELHVESVVGLVTKSCFFIKTFVESELDWKQSLLYRLDCSSSITSVARNSSMQILEQTALVEILVDYYGF
ncbi:ATPase 2, plasma membrane-type-like [Brassica rapa]|uniref:Uncharacterized protein n=2 Tax=Brassica TaxID=3705 RepID=A0A8D9I5G3_BRACM|nr:ATPase 2, plasma membrane-type-like [Brassica rapa]CAF2360006.1 unnamed protein product [Brassica napus]CAG7911973.1 unnamed protein product [Brassica rapa]